MKRSLVGGIIMLVLALGIGTDLFITAYHTEHSILRGIAIFFGVATPFLVSGILLIMHNKRLQQ